MVEKGLDSQDDIAEESQHAEKSGQQRDQSNQLAVDARLAVGYEDFLQGLVAGLQMNKVEAVFPNFLQSLDDRLPGCSIRKDCFVAELIQVVRVEGIWRL